MGALVRLQGDFARKLASIREIKEKLIPNIPRDQAIYTAGQLIQGELNAKEQTPINRISGNLARSFGASGSKDSLTLLPLEQRVEARARGEWAVTQVQAIAPYAPDVFVYAQRRFGMNPFDSVRRRTADYLRDGAIEEWEYAWGRIDKGLSYKYHPLYGE